MMRPTPQTPTDPTSHIPDLSDATERARLTPAATRGVIALADIWRLNAAEAAALLGDVSERSWFRLKKGESTEPLPQDVLMRISLLVGIFKGLRLMFSEPLADDWVRLPNQGPVFGGQTPLTLMLRGGIPAMMRIRQHVDALRGGL